MVYEMEKILSYDELVERDSHRDLMAELLEATAEVERNHRAKITTVQVTEAVQARQAMNLTQNRFAELLGISIRTLQEWEQGRRRPNKSAQMLLKVAISHPEVVKEVTAELTEA